MLGNLMLPKSQESRKQDAQDLHFHVQHLVPMIANQPVQPQQMHTEDNLFSEMAQKKSKLDSNI